MRKFYFYAILLVFLIQFNSAYSMPTLSTEELHTKFAIGLIEEQLEVKGSNFSASTPISQIGRGGTMEDVKAIFSKLEKATNKKVNSEIVAQVFGENVETINNKLTVNTIVKLVGILREINIKAGTEELNELHRTCMNKLNFENASQICNCQLDIAKTELSLNTIKVVIGIRNSDNKKVYANQLAEQGKFFELTEAHFFEMSAMKCIGKTMNKQNHY